MKIIFHKLFHKFAEKGYFYERIFKKLETNDDFGYQVWKQRFWEPDKEKKEILSDKIAQFRSKIKRPYSIIGHEIFNLPNSFRTEDFQ